MLGLNYDQLEEAGSQEWLLRQEGWSPTPIPLRIATGPQTVLVQLDPLDRPVLC
jgi:hypothetical protein